MNEKISFQGGNLKNLLLLSALLLSISLQASTYFSASYGIAKTSSSAGFADGIDGKAIALTLGKQTSHRFAWEASIRRTTFDSFNYSQDLGQLGSLNINSEIEALMIGGGFRYFFLRYLNLHAGLGFANVKYNATIQTSGGMFPGAGITEDDSGIGIYYGLGLQFPMGPVELLVDYTVNQFASDVSSNEISGGLRIRF